MFSSSRLTPEPEFRCTTADTPAASASCECCWAAREAIPIAETTPLQKTSGDDAAEPIWESLSATLPSSAPDPTAPVAMPAAFVGTTRIDIAAGSPAVLAKKSRPVAPLLDCPVRWVALTSLMSCVAKAL